MHCTDIAERHYPSVTTNITKYCGNAGSNMEMLVTPLLKQPKTVLENLYGASLDFFVIVKRLYSYFGSYITKCFFLLLRKMHTPYNFSGYVL